MSAATQALGMTGERIAERWLRRHGWRIVQRRFRNGRRDIDLIAELGSVASAGRTIAFVEVKARRGDRFGDPVEAVHWRKQRELRRSALVWIDRYGDPNDVYRFDVIGVLLSDSRVRLRHVENAFALPAGGWLDGPGSTEMAHP